MKILVVADNQRGKEFKDKTAAVADLTLEFVQPDEGLSVEFLNRFEMIFDLNFNSDESSIQTYSQLQNRIVVLNTVTIALHQFYAMLKNSNSFFVGINALPTFINKRIAELALLKEADKSIVTKCFEKLNWQTEFVKDRVGLVTPRVICMIINEAFYTLQEGTANKTDINLAMRLGTNYPFGPFEWMEQIGIANVYDTLNALYNDTLEERYKICPLLKTQYLESL